MTLCKMVPFCAITAICFASSARAQAVVTFDENTPNRTVHGDFAVPGAVTVTPESLVFDAVPLPSAPEVLGATGASISPGIDFAPSKYQWEMRFRILSGNNAPAVAAAYTDRDGTEFLPQFETYVFNFDISSLNPADGWVTRRQGFGAPLFVDQPADGVQNPGLRGIFFTNANIGTTRFHFELDYLRIVPVPEPHALLMLAGIAALVPARFRARLATRGV
jgi:hypothetical protein